MICNFVLYLQFEEEKICMPVLEIELLAGFFVSCSLGIFVV